jgi:hypothetical protein
MAVDFNWGAEPPTLTAGQGRCTSSAKGACALDENLSSPYSDHH